MLEDMLLKWAFEGKRRSRIHEAFRKPHVDDSSVCTESSPHTSSDPTTAARNGEDNQLPAILNQSKATNVGKINMKMSLVSKERAIILRDENLLAAGNPDPHQLSISVLPTPSPMRIKVPTPALTVGNMALLSQELEVNPFDMLNLNSAYRDRSNSDGSTDGGSTPGEDHFSLERRELALESDGQTTVIADKEGSYS